MKETDGGFVLILVLLIVAVLMALAVNFAYGVYVNASGIHNMQILEELSVEGSSLIDSSAPPFLQALALGQISLDQQQMEIPIDDGTTVYFQAGDENSRFNLNTLVNQNGDLNKDAYQSFQRLLKALDLDAGIADKVVEWINPAALPEAEAEGEGSTVTNGYLTSVPELALFIGKASYDTLKNYVTVFGNGLIDINSAPAPVLESLSGDVSDDRAEQIIEWRKLEPFKNIGDLDKVAGFDKLGMELAPRITVSSSAVRIKASATRQGITRIVEGVLDTSGNILYWREY
ncbi:MAG: type II secretion system protein GspK [Nitrospiraceae bacterium]|nr:type II secretion system protein GspK [Nitrospiraceae bacterium]